MNLWALGLIFALALFWGGVVWVFGLAVVLKAAVVGILLIAVGALALCAVPLVAKDG